MIRRMLIHTIVATLLVGAAALSWQAFAKGQGMAGTVAALTGVVGHDDHHGGDHDED